MRKLACLLAVSSALAAPAWAQDGDPIILAPDRMSPDTITVTATGVRTDIANTGQAITLIGRAEIEQVQGADVERVLRRVPSATLTRNGPVGAFTSLSLRGASGDQLLVLVDGVRVADPAAPAGGFDFGNLLTGTVNKLDILRGSNSTIWGSDAVGGVVDVSTRRTSGAQAAVEYGSRGTLFANAATGVEGDRYFASLTGGWLRTGGFSAAAGGTERDPFRQGSLGGTVFFDATDQIEVFATGRYARGQLDIDGFSFTPPFLPVDTSERQVTRQYSGAVGAAYYGTDLTLRGFWSLADTARENFASPAATQPDFASDGHSERLSLRGEYRLIGGLAVAFGAEREWTDYRTTFARRAETAITGAYAQLGWVLGGLAVHAGARIDAHERFGSEWSLGGDVSYVVAPDWRVKASVGEGFKAPTLFQLFSDFGNEALQPERSTSFDIGVERGSRGGPLHLALTAFRRNSESLIDFAFTDGRPNGGYFNVGRARAQGMELELGTRLSERLSAGAVYALIDTQDRTAGVAGQGNELPRRPRHAGTVYADWRTPVAGLSIGADLRLVGDSFDDRANLRPIDGHAVADLRASLPVGERLELFGRVENLFDAQYQTVLGYAQPGRGVFAGVRLRR